MRKKEIAFILFTIVMLSLCGCADKEPESIDFDFHAEVETTQEAESLEEREDFSFSKLKRYKFLFASGAGGWGTILHINQDGSFSGEYSDSEMGEKGEEYPYGTTYQSNFNGRFTQPVKVNEYTYSMQIAEINYVKEVGTEEIKDSIRYCYTDVYGLDEENDILIYMPGAPLAELPEEFRSWVGYHDLSATTDTELPFYALNNEAQQQGFSGHDMVSEFEEDLANEERWADEIERFIEQDATTTMEYNEKTQALFEEWDYMLNKLWEILQFTQDADTMAALTVEEREWIAWKEQEIEKAGADYEGGSMQTMFQNMKAAELTKDRVYELMKHISNNN
ncbi:MAG: DUF1311 domain-containing protein [Lachnospiraceae bacterium]|nr:DUF1311 domain-containing protein [Lachnospiraceae bacterium]